MEEVRVRRVASGMYALPVFWTVRSALSHVGGND